MLARWARQRQRAEGLSNRDFALKINCHQTTWHRILHGERGVGPELARRIAAAYPEDRQTIMELAFAEQVESEEAAVA